MKMINYEPPKKSTKRKHKHPSMPNDSFNLVIAGPSRSGKANTLLNMIYDLLLFDEIVLYAKNIHQAKYQSLLQDFVENIDPEVGYKVIETPQEIIPLKKLDRESQKIVIFDDYMCEKNQNEIVNYFTNGRHHNCTVIYLTQSFFKVPKSIRDNVENFCIFKFHPKENKRISADLGLTPGALEKATKEPFSFLWVDQVTKKELKNFDEVI